MKELYKKILDTLTSGDTKQSFIDRGLPLPNFIDIEKGQYFDMENISLIPCPALLLGWDITHPSNVNNRQSQVNIFLNIIYENQRKTENLFFEQAKEEALKYFDFIDCVQTVIRDLEIENTGKLKLERETILQHESLQVAVCKLTYKCTYNNDNMFQKKYREGEVNDLALN